MRTQLPPVLYRKRLFQFEKNFPPSLSLQSRLAQKNCLRRANPTMLGRCTWLRRAPPGTPAAKKPRHRVCYRRRALARTLTPSKLGAYSMANKSQDKGKAKNNKPKLTAKQKKEKKLKKALEGKNRYDA
jgi:hypothetical protein